MTLDARSRQVEQVWTTIVDQAIQQLSTSHVEAHERLTGRLGTKHCPQVNPAGSGMHRKKWPVSCRWILLLSCFWQPNTEIQRKPQQLNTLDWEERSSSLCWWSFESSKYHKWLSGLQGKLGSVYCPSASRFRNVNGYDSFGPTPDQKRTKHVLLDSPRNPKNLIWNSPHLRRFEPMC